MTVSLSIEAGATAPLLARTTSRSNWVAPVFSGVSWAGFWVTSITYGVMLYHSDPDATSMNPEGKYTGQLEGMEVFGIAGIAAIAGAVVHTAVKAGAKAGEVMEEEGKWVAAKSFAKEVWRSATKLDHEEGIIANSIAPAFGPIYALCTYMGR